MSKTLTEIAQIVSEVEDDLYDKVDEVIALKMRISKLEEFCKAVIRYAGNTGDDYLSNKARELLESER